MKTDNVMKNQRKWFNVGYEYWYNEVWVGGGGGAYGWLNPIELNERVWCLPHFI